MPIQRLTLFKVPSENIQAMRALYRTLSETQSRNGKPYILSIRGRPNLCPLERSQGFNFAALTRFASLDDVRFYDEECEAHKALKAKSRDLVQQPWEPPLTVYVQEEEEAGQEGQQQRL